MESTASKRWQQAYRQKQMSADEAVRLVEPASTVYLSGNAATPRALADALANRALVFRNAYAAGSHTMPSTSALFASRMPAELGGVLRSDGPAATTRRPGGEGRRES